jgi:putative membrane protein insertion efficiency factor
MKALRFFSGIFNRVGLFLVWLLVVGYRLFLKPWLPQSCCRFEPTCSQYLLDAVGKYGFGLGVLRGFMRILRCRPGCPGGHDPA